MYLDLNPKPAAIQPVELSIKTKKDVIMTSSIITSIVSQLLKTILSVLSPEIKVLLESSIKSIYDRAKQTSNPYDDFALEFIAKILGITLD